MKDPTLNQEIIDHLTDDHIADKQCIYTLLDLRVIFTDIVQQVAVRQALRDGDEGLLRNDRAGHHARQGERAHPHARRGGLRLRILASTRRGVQGEGGTM